MQDTTNNLIGKNLGKYRLVEYIGSGGMARVFKGYHPLLDRFVAIKILHNELAEDADFVEQFILEARNLASLQHANIVQIFDIDVEANWPFIAMEYIDGYSLKEALEEHKQNQSRFDYKKTIRIIQSVGAALSYAHRQNMAHRDVKPSNVLIEFTGRIVLADFGLAKLRARATSALVDTFKGTPAYMSPEQGMGMSGGGVSDIYSLGIMFFELITGKLPFDAENPLEIVMKHVEEPLPSPSSVADGVPPRIEEIICKALEKDPSSRYPSVDALLEQLRDLSEAKTGMLPTAKLAVESDLPAGALSPTISQSAQISIHFMDTGQIMYLERGREYTLGRTYQKDVPDIDLTPFKGYEWGISRSHAKLVLENDMVAIEDLGSSNGTWYAGKKIQSHQPLYLQHADVVKLGKLKLQVLIYE
ncbi:MAG: FHA domain-containing serine/threonine-protein kinase [Anaerolineae bacterium]|nr:FHA domain-containing serine/threonine-protein kinase [Anaerolineae bacterium]